MPSKTLSERFWDKVRITPGCWEWEGYKERAGYGRVGWGSKKNNKMLTHRGSWILTHGDIPDGMCVMHKCDNPGCVNPGHLQLGTHQENMADRDRKGRGAMPDNSGDNHWTRRRVS